MATDVLLQGRGRGRSMIWGAAAAAAALLLIVACERAPKEDEILARINDRVLTRTEFQDEVADRKARDVMFQDTAAGRKRLLDGIITRELLLQDAVNNGIDQEPDFRRSIKNYYEQTLIEKLVKKRLGESGGKVEEDDLRKRYDEMGTLYRADLFEIRAGLAPEAGQADATSICTMGGPYEKDRPFEPCKACHKANVVEGIEVERGEVPPALYGLVASLEPGGIGGPVRVEDGIYMAHLIKAEQRELPPFDDIKEDLRKQLSEERQLKEMDGWIEGLRRGAKIAIREEFLVK